MMQVPFRSQHVVANVFRQWSTNQLLFFFIRVVASRSSRCATNLHTPSVTRSNVDCAEPPGMLGDFYLEEVGSGAR